MRLFSVFLLYSSLLLYSLCLGEQTHQEVISRPQLTKEAERAAADALLIRILESFKKEAEQPYPGPEPEFSEDDLKKILPQLLKFPDLLRARTPEILSVLNAKLRGKSLPIGTCLELLSVTVNPELISVFEKYLASCAPTGRDCFEAANGLSLIYKAHPELVTEARKKVLFDLLKSTGSDDLTRLYLRQTLPESLAREIDEQVYEWKKEHRPAQALALATKNVDQRAEGTVKHDRGDVATRALAFQYLLISDRPHPNIAKDIEDFFKEIITSASEKPKIKEIDRAGLNPPSKEKLEEFIERISQNPQGLGLRIHDGIQLENLIFAAQKAGLELDPKLVGSLRELTQKQFEVIWNSGRPLVRHGGDSVLSNYAQSALILSYGSRPLGSIGKEVLASLESLRAETNPETGKPRFYDYTSEDYRRDATDASSAGRALTGHLALYQHAETTQKAERAQELLKAARNFEIHFSQLFEESPFMRTHDRNPKGEGMADYYGYANIVYEAEALVQLSNDRSLDGLQQVEVRRLAGRITNRILNLIKPDGRYSGKEEYDFLVGIALDKLISRYPTLR